ncbi:MAG: helix-turn-helix domain-containing protein [Corynebacterium matruchotii]|jgi:transcriptional regulator with XRE-family HTH domain
MRYKLSPLVLDKIRSNRGFSSDAQLAHEVGVTVGTISNIRRGATPSFKTAIRLLELADITDMRAAIVKVAEAPAA